MPAVNRMQAHSSKPWTRRHAILAGLAACGCRVVSAVDDAAPHVRILFLGNSYTAFNGLPAMVGEIMLSSGVLAPHIGSYLQGGYRLEQHATDKVGLDLLKKGADDGKPWDVLVVQEQSVLSAVAAVDEKAHQTMQDGLQKLVTAAREVNPQMLIMLFQVWPRHDNQWKQPEAEVLSTGADAPQAMARIRVAATNAVKAVKEANTGAKILVSPVGEFWRLALDAYPALPLYANDGSHPDMLGTLLSALVISGSIGGREIIERSTWSADCPFSQVQRVKKVLLDHPEVFKQANP